MKTQSISSGLLAAIALVPFTSAAVHRHRAREGWDTHHWTGGWHGYGGSWGDNDSNDNSAASSATTLSTSMSVKWSEQKTQTATASTSAPVSIHVAQVSSPSTSAEPSSTTTSTALTTIRSTKTVVATTTVQAPTTAASTPEAAPTEPSSTPEAAPVESSTPSSSPEPVTTEAPTGEAVSAAADVATTSSTVEADPITIASSSASAAPSVSAVSNTNSGSSPLSLSRKSGLSGYVGIADTQAFKDLSPYLSWYSDYTPTTQNVGDIKGVGMLWGNGQTCTSNTDDSQRMASFKSDVATNSTPPEIMFGFYEPDCYCPMSSDMSTSDGTTLWNSLLAPLKAKGTVLGSPSMCKQKDEDWLTPFSKGLDADWDVTSIHINKNNIDGVKEDVEYYVATYGRPVFVSEFACVDDKNDFTACTDQGQINQFISDTIDFFQGNESVVAFGPSNGEGLGTVWPLTDNGELTATGKAYLDKIKSL